MFLVNSRYRLFSATPFGSKSKSLHLMRAHLLPKLRCHFAEFLNQGSLTRLRILSSPTCVGLRYGHLENSLRGFSWQYGINQFTGFPPPHHLSALTRERICLSPPPTSLYRDFHHPDGLPSCVPPSLKRFPGGTGILTCFPSATPFGLTLGTDLPWADDLYPGNLRLTASGILTRFIVTHVSIIPCTTSSSPLGLPSQASAMLPYHSVNSEQ